MHLITGGAGFIGTNLAATLLARGEEVVVLDNFARPGSRLNAEWLKERYPDVGVAEADVRDDADLLAELVGGAAAVYHLAGQVAVTSAIANPREDFENNALGALNVLEAVRLANPGAVVVYASTNKVYGALDGIAVYERPTRYEYADGRRGIAEGEPLDFHSPYGCSKGAADQYVHDYARVYGLRTIVLRQSCIYGPRQFGVEEQGWLAWFAIAGAAGIPITLYGTGKQVRDVLYVDDLVELMITTVEHADRAAGQIYNVGGGPELSLSLLDAITVLEDELDCRFDVRFDAPRAGDQRIYISDTTKALTELGWTPRTGLTDGLNAMAAWVFQNRELLDTTVARPRP